MDKRGLTLLEIIISTIILALVVSGLVNVLVASRGFIQHNRYRLGAGELGRQFVDPLQAYVRQDTWGSNYLGTATNPPNATDPTGFYTAQYAVTTPSSNPNIRKAKVTVSWTEPK